MHTDKKYGKPLSQVLIVKNKLITHHYFGQVQHEKQQVYKFFNLKSIISYSYDFEFSHPTSSVATHHLVTAHLCRIAVN